MTTESESPAEGRDREVPEDQSRKQILCLKQVRAYLRRRSNENGHTYSRQLDEWLPDDPDVVHEIEDEDIVNIKATPEVHEQVLALTGKRVKPGDVIAYYGLLDAVERGDYEAAADLAATIPDRLWDVLAQLDQNNVLSNPDDAQQ